MSAIPAHQRRLDLDPETFCDALERLGVHVTLVAPDYPAAGSNASDVGDRGACAAGTTSSADAGRHHSPAFPSRAARSRRSADALAAARRTRSPSRGRRLRPGACPDAVRRALRRTALARKRGIPCIATYHTHFEEYLFHYIRFLPRSRAATTRRAPWPDSSATPLMRSSCPRQADGGHAAGLWHPQPLQVIPTGMPESQFVRGNGFRFRQAVGHRRLPQAGPVRRPRRLREEHRLSARNDRHRAAGCSRS
jgi:1,2-diacylglycerol 3-alpha-glucosyltransferase